MKVKLKKAKDQVMVITGASSGIGLATAYLAAKKGARVVLSSRNEEDLKEAVERIQEEGGEASYVVADVASEQDMQRLADEAVSRYGRIDTWVNNAAIAIYGKLEEVPMAEKRHLFDVNFWGVVNGSRAAVPILRQNGGALINIGSILSERAIPLQGIYVASKHALKGYTDTLRMELEAEHAPVSVTLIKPGAINTPYPLHARNRMNSTPTNPPPIYSPSVVARTILECAQHPHRDVLVGGGAKLFSLMEKFAPRFTDIYMEKKLFNEQKSDYASPNAREGFDFAPSREGKIEGDHRGHVMKSSLYTSLSLHPMRATALVLGGLVSGMAAYRYLKTGSLLPS